MLRGIHDFIEEISLCDSDAGATSIVTRAIQSIGFSSFNFIGGRIIKAAHGKSKPTFDDVPHYVSTWSRDWISYYTGNGYFGHDPILKGSFLSTLPVDWASVEKESQLKNRSSEMPPMPVSRTASRFPFTAP
ncbi:MAG: autoinducer binding domain-containing protein [Rhodospirillaceae bacterium]